jgi:hypothetical protein
MTPLVGYALPLIADYGRGRNIWPCFEALPLIVQQNGVGERKVVVVLRRTGQRWSVLSLFWMFEKVKPCPKFTASQRRPSNIKADQLPTLDGNKCVFLNH